MWERWWEIAPEPPKGDKLEKDGGIMGAVGAVGMVGVLRETQEFSGFLERGLKIEIKNFAKGVAGEAIKTFGKV